MRCLERKKGQLLVVHLKISYIEQDCKTLLHKIASPRLPFKWGINPYRGCLHSCIYCFARYTHSYLDLDPSQDFETTIFVKTNAPQVLRKELSRPSWKKELINLGSVCDPYQPAEENYQITRQLLKELARFRTPVTIATKSDLIVRDVTLLSEMAKESYLDVVLSISSINEDIRKELEPRAPTTEQRLEAIQILRENGIKTGVLMMPIAPYLNDSSEVLDRLFQALSTAGVNFVIPGILYLPRLTKPRFFDFLEKNHPELLEKYRTLYRGRSAPKWYRKKMYKQLTDLRQKYQLFDFGASRRAITPSKKQSTLDKWL
ncbi:MAG: radical SAM protein [Candidatus Heimdallarchaeota archaeon]|nr:radical SAM protein [Candidatus Heimdallarchaeota archaeon]